MTKEEYIAKYGEKDGLRRWKKSEYNKQYRQEHREELLKYKKQYNQEHRKEKLEYMKQYQQEHREELSKYLKMYYQEHREEMLEHHRRYHKRYYQAHHKEILEYSKQHHKEYQETPYGRAQLLIGNYRRNDRKYNRGECTLTAQWVVDNIFSKRCLYCGESDWRKLGTDRIDNSKPHTQGNVVCCCKKCNDRRKKMDFLKFAYSMGAKDSNELTIKY